MFEVVYQSNRGLLGKWKRSKCFYTLAELRAWVGDHLWPESQVDVYIAGKPLAVWA